MKCYAQKSGTYALTFRIVIFPLASAGMHKSCTNNEKNYRQYNRRSCNCVNFIFTYNHTQALRNVVSGSLRYYSISRVPSQQISQRPVKPTCYAFAFFQSTTKGKAMNCRVNPLLTQLLAISCVKNLFTISIHTIYKKVFDSFLQRIIDCSPNLITRHSQ